MIWLDSGGKGHRSIPVDGIRMNQTCLCDSLFFSEAFSKQKLYQSISSISGFLSFGHLDFFHFTEKKGKPFFL